MAWTFHVNNVPKTEYAHNAFSFDRAVDYKWELVKDLTLEEFSEKTGSSDYKSLVTSHADIRMAAFKPKCK